MSQKFFFTRQDFDDLCRRITEVEQNVQKHTVAVGQVVDSSGDAWHDNQLYYEQRMSESWSNDLRNLLDVKRQAVIIETLPPDDGMVRFGTVVKVKDLQSDEILVYRVSSYMITAPEGREGVRRISYVSPIGRLLIQARVGDVKEGMIGGRRKKFEVLDISS